MPVSYTHLDVYKRQGLVEPNEEFHEGAVREMYEETGLKFTPLKVDSAFERPYFTTVGMTDESCATVYGYAEGEISKDAQEDTEEIEHIQSCGSAQHICRRCWQFFQSRIYWKKSYIRM